MNWQLKIFEELTTKELHEILRVRAEMFMVEQNCVYQDLELKEQEVRISTQLYLKKLYESMGFVTTSEVYLEDEIEHIQMLYKVP